MPVSGPILVSLANGTRGSAVVRAAERRGHVVRALVRKPHSDCSTLSSLVTGDLDDPASLVVAARGCAHAVLQVPTADELTMVRQVINALDAFRHVGVRSILLKLASASRPAPCSEPSFVANAAIETLVRNAGIAFAIVRPTMYLDNLLKPSVRADIATRGIFSPPIKNEQRIAWTSVDDCALATVLLLEQDCYGGDHIVAGPESVAGDGLASRLSAALDRMITYHAESLDAFERDVDAAMGSGMGRRVASKFRYFRDYPDDADQILAPAQGPISLSGFVPTSIEAWARQRRHWFDR